MGGNMSWPRFRGRNNLLHRPNYYTGGENAPAATEPCGACRVGPTEHHKWEAYLSGEIDRMVYGWWLSEPFQQGCAAAAGITLDQVAIVMRYMLHTDSIENVSLITGEGFWRGLP